MFETEFIGGEVGEVEWSPYIVNLRTGEGLGVPVYEKTDSCQGRHKDNEGIHCLIKNLKLGSQGVASWVRESAKPANPQQYELIIHDTQGTQTIDSGNIDPASLTLTDTTVTWTKDGAQQTRELQKGS